jgi:hypothetical protein
VEIARQDSDTALFLHLMYAAEQLAKLACAGLVSALCDDVDKHRYRLSLQRQRPGQHHGGRKLARRRGSVALSDVPPNSPVVGVPTHIVYNNGQRVLITDPHEIKDPVSDALIALSARVEELEERLGATERWAQPFADEEAERATYRVELERLKVYVSMGEGI